MQQYAVSLLCIIFFTCVLFLLNIKSVNQSMWMPTIAKGVFDHVRGDDSGGEAVGEGEVDDGEPTKAQQKTPPSVRYEDAALFAKLEYTKTDMHVDGHIIDINVTNKYVEKPLRVSVLLHSHVDPGWLETFEAYYTNKVKSILDLGVAHLTAEPALRFIWSETSFLARWWKDANETQKQQFKKLVDDGRLEVCGGAWVMTDEATPHHFASIDNIIEGQRYIQQILGIRPNVSWSVDPFGHGLMMPYLLPHAGINHMVVGRLNDGQKAQMRQKMAMRFKWKQPFHSTTAEAPDGPLVNTLPFLYYTTRNGCGTSDAVCCQYHVGPSANWCSGTIMQITPANVQEYATNLLEQYKQVQHVYNTEHILITVGDDFYLSHEGDWASVRQVYLAIFKFFDDNPQYKTKMRFSTVSEFFAGLSEEKLNPVPTLTGDFFPYVGIESSSYKYWTGFFTHRPFFKRLGRIIEGKLRALDLIRVLTGVSTESEALTTARRDLALFQHHDAITGTSKVHVMNDYLERLDMAFHTISEQHGDTLAAFTQRPRANISAVESFTNNKTTYLPADETITIKERISLLIFNQLTNVDEHKIRVVIDKSNVRVIDDSGVGVKSQLNPVFRREGLPWTGVYELVFIAHIRPLSLAEFTIETISEGGENSAKLADVYSSSPDTISKSPSTKILPWNEFEGIIGNNKYQLEVFNGEIKVVKGPPTNISWILETMDDLGGAYVFEAMKSGFAQKISNTTQTVLLRGQVEDVIITYHERVQQVVTVTHSPSGVDSLLEGFIDIRLFTNLIKGTAMFLHVDSDIYNTKHFSSDVNGLFLLKRTYNKEKSLDGNVFPSATSAMIEDRLSRLTVHVGQPSGVVSAEEGRLSVMVDRVVVRDDGKGLPYNECLDDHSPDIRLRVMVEERDVSAEGSLGSSHSIPSQHALDSLRYPPVVFTTNDGNEGELENSPTVLPISEWPCQFDLVNMRFVSQKEMLIIIRRLNFDGSVIQKHACSTDEKKAWTELEKLSKGELFHSDLSGTSIGEKATEESFLTSLKEPFALSTLFVKLS